MRWTTHAWTYQESVYSTLCILFTANRVLYSCSRGLHSEEREDDISITSGLESKLPCHRADPRYPVIDTANSYPTPFDEYAVHVESFAERHPSYQNDALRAFTSDETTNLGMHFACGLPTEIFELALCWMPCIVVPSPGDGLEQDCILTFPSFQLQQQ